MEDFFYGLDNVVGTIVVFLIIGIIIFLILREFYCWYFKINQLVSLQKQQGELLEKMLTEIKRSNAMYAYNNSLEVSYLEKKEDNQNK